MRTVATYVELYREEREDEMRVVLLAFGPDGSIQIQETTDGVWTLAIFGSLSRTHAILLDGIAAARLSHELGASNNKGLVDALHTFFADGSFLCDLQDFLDIADITFAYSVVNGSYAALRPQVFERAGRVSQSFFQK